MNAVGNMLLRLLSNPVKPMSDAEVRAAEPRAITLRLAPELRHYLDCRATQLGDLPVANLVTMMLKAYMDADAQGDFTDHNKFAESVRLIANRVRYLFSSHEYTVAEVCVALDEFGITPKIFLSDMDLVDHLTNEAYSQIAEAFAVDQAWLMSPMHSRTARNPDVLRHNAAGIFHRIQQWSSARELECIIPFCRSDKLDGSRLVYSGHGDDTPVSIGVKLKEKNGYINERFIVWRSTPFDYDAARIEYKALLLELYNHFKREFHGVRLDPKVYERVVSGEDIVPKQAMGLHNHWDPEFYVGAHWGDNPGLEEDELPRVREEADRIFRVTRESGAVQSEIKLEATQQK